MSLEFKESSEEVAERDAIKKLRQYEEDFKDLIADNVWKYLDRAGMNVDKVTEREIDADIESAARELADILARKAQNVNKIIAALELFSGRLKSIGNDVLAISTKLDAVTRYVDGRLQDDLKDIASMLNAAHENIDKALKRIEEVVKNEDEYVREQEDKMDEMAKEASEEILSYYGLLDG